MEEGVPVVGGHLLGGSVSVVMAVVDNQAFFAGMLEPSNLAEEL